MVVPNESRLTQNPTPSRLRTGGREAIDDGLRHALEAAGVEFTNGDQPGVRRYSAR